MPKTILVPLSTTNATLGTTPSTDTDRSKAAAPVATATSAIPTVAAPAVVSPAAAAKKPALKAKAIAKPKAKAVTPVVAPVVAPAAKHIAKTTVKASAPVVAAKPKKAKLVRDSFTIPKAEYELLDALKARAVRLKQPAKKSELLRAGIKLMVSLTDVVFAAALKSIPALKTGRPKAEPVAAKTTKAVKTKKPAK